MQNLKNMRLKFWEAKNVSWDGFLYRIIMKIAHKYHWHYAPPLPIIKEGEVHLWCKWCGFRQTMNDNLNEVIADYNKIDNSIKVDSGSTQTYFWTEEWQAGEREVERDLQTGQYEDFDSLDDLLETL